MGVTLIVADAPPQGDDIYFVARVTQPHPPQRGWTFVYPRGVMLNKVKHLAGCKAVQTKNNNTIRETLRYAQGDRRTEN